MTLSDPWLTMSPGPRARPAREPFGEDPIEWDVFISYQSLDRPWAVALYDQLVTAGFEVFLDQFALQPGMVLDESLATALESSASGVLIVSEHTAASEWVRHERDTMRQLRHDRQGSALPFHYVIARIDKAKLPFQDQGDLFADFSEYYEDGPRGGELVKLGHALVGSSLPNEAVRKLLKAEEEVKDALLEIAAAGAVGSAARVHELGCLYAGTSPLIASKAAASLVSTGRTEPALEVIAAGLRRFPRSLRLQQLEALALRRMERIEEAQGVLARLYEDGHRDPETLGIFAATFMKLYERNREIADLERSRSLYVDAFTVAPDNAYVGINAAAKSALLGDWQSAKNFAQRVGKLTKRHGDGQDYFPSMTLAEALLIVGKYDEAANLYEKTRQRHPNRKGDLASTLHQAEALIEVLEVSQEAAQKVRNALKILDSAPVVAQTEGMAKASRKLPELDETNSKCYRARQGRTKRAVVRWEPASYKLEWGDQKFDGPHVEVSVAGEVYGVDIRVFFSTHTPLRDKPNLYVKDALVRAMQVDTPTKINVKIGAEVMQSVVEPGGWLVQNPGGEVYYNTPAKFEELYELAEG